jgi:hypothetical protein
MLNEEKSTINDDKRETDLGDALCTDSSSRAEKLSLPTEGVDDPEKDEVYEDSIKKAKIDEMVSEILNDRALREPPVHNENEKALGSEAVKDRAQIGRPVPGKAKSTDDETVEGRRPLRAVKRDYVKMNSYGLQARTMPFVDFSVDTDGMDPLNVEDEVRKAIDDELRQMQELQVFEFLSAEEVSGIRGRILPTKIIVTVKRDARGVLVKVKARLVVLGNLQYAFPDDYDKSSPTVRYETIMFLFNMATLYDLPIDVLDVGGAFLEADLDTEEHVFLSGDLAQDFIRLYPETGDYLDMNGRLVIRLKKAMYGLKESPMAWYNCLKTALSRLDFEPCEHDSALLIRRVGDKVVHFIAIHVDDLLSIGTRESMYELNRFMGARFRKITCIEDMDAFNYLKIEVVRDRALRTLTMREPAKIAQVISEYNQEEVIEAVPYTEKLFQDEPDSKPCDPEVYRSLVAKLMWISRIRPDIRLPVNYLSTRVTVGTEADLKKALRVVGYLNGTRELGVRFAPTTMEIFCSADASFAVHQDQKGQSGFTLHFGEDNAAFLVSSKKQKLVTLSSTESELVSLTEAAQVVMMMREMLENIGIHLNATVVEQDNKASILLSKRGAGRAGRAKAISVRYFWIKQHIDSGAIKLNYVPSERLLADGLTKPLPRDRFFEFRNRVLNCRAI